MSLENIEKNIEQLKKLKSILRNKINNVDLQIQKKKTQLSKEREKEKLKHIKSQKTFFKKIT